MPPGEGPPRGTAGEAAIDDALAALARVIRALDCADVAGASDPADSSERSGPSDPGASTPAPNIPRPDTPAAPRLVEVTIAVSGLAALADALAELRARPDVLEARVRRLEPGQAVVTTLLTG